MRAHTFTAEVGLRKGVVF